MLRKCGSLLLALCLVLGLCAVPAGAEESSGDIVEYSCGKGEGSGSYLFNKATGVIVAKAQNVGNTVSGDLVVPDTIEQIPVVAVGESAFQQNGDLKSVKLPKSVKQIGGMAFGYCDQLNSVTMEGVETIEYSAFLGCTNLSLCLPKSVSQIKPGAFSGADVITVDQENTSFVTVGEGKNIGLYSADKTVLYHCPQSAAAFTVDPAVKTLAEGAFQFCNGLKEVTVPEGVTTLEKFVFGNCATLTKIILPSTLKTVHEDAFFGARGTISFLKENEHGFVIQQKELYGPTQGSSSGSFTLYYCDQGSNSLFVPKEVDYIPYNLLNNLYQLKTITVEEGNTRYQSLGGGILWDDQDKMILRVAIGVTEALIPNGIKVIKNNAFGGCDKLKTVTVPDSVTEIQSAAFDGCTALNALKIGTSAAMNCTIADGAFMGINPDCTIKIREGANYSVTGSGGVVSTDNRLLYIPLKGSTIRIPDGVREIGSYVFSDGYGRKGSITSRFTVEFPDSVISIAANAALQSSTVQEVKLSKNLKTIGAWAFKDCQNLEKLELPDSVSSIGAGAFTGCKKLAAVTTPEKEEAPAAFMAARAAATSNTLEAGAFSACPMLKQASVPSSITAIAAGAFENCPKLSILQIPATVQNIDADAFPLGQAITIYGEEGSAAETFVKAHDVKDFKFSTGEPVIDPPTPPGPSGGGDTELDEPDVPAGEVTQEQLAAAVKQFPDIANYWGKEDAAWAYREGLFNGVEDNRFAPNGTTDRAMFATVLYRMAGKPAVKDGAGFADVPENAYYADAVAWAVSQGIVTGVGGDRFAPKGNIKREELALMLYRMSGENKAAADRLSSFGDAGSIGSWAKDAVNWAVDQKILNGKGNGVLDPKGPATRGEAAAMLRRYAGLE